MTAIYWNVLIVHNNPGQFFFQLITILPNYYLRSQSRNEAMGSNPTNCENRRCHRRVPKSQDHPDYYE